MLIDLDTPEGRDPVRVGSKAAALAAARAAGAPVLPGIVVAGTASRGHMVLGARTLAERGSGGARLTVSNAPIDFGEALMISGRGLGDRLVARSSTLLEASGEWSGAFTSYLDLAPAELPRAVVGCWASAFSVAALQRQEAAGIAPGSFPMSVLVQRALDPEAGGWAEIDDLGVVTVHGVKGSPAPLMQGWARGDEARHEGKWTGDELIELLGSRHLDSLRDMMVQVGEALGVTRCEWALTDRVWGLQFGRGPVGVRPTAVPVWGDVPPPLVDLARLVVLAPGALGEEMVIPWAIAGLPDVDPTTSPGSSPVERARELCRDLVEEVWGLPVTQALGAARRSLSSARGADTGGYATRVGYLRRPDARKAARLLGILAGLRHELAERGVVADPRDVWSLDLDAIESAIDGRPVAAQPRLGIGKWEPFVASVTLVAGEQRGGAPASPGLGAGRRIVVTDHHERRNDRRGVITAAHPIPNLASLLWDAAAVATSSGSPAAHLFEAARALRVPAVCGVELDGSPGDVVAVDGHSGMVATLDLDREL